MRDLKQYIRLQILINTDMSMKEIQDGCLNIPERTVIRAVKRLEKLKEIEHKKIFGKGKRKRYTISEKKPKSDVTIERLELESWNNEKIQKLSRDELFADKYRVKITQTQLARNTTTIMKLYHKELKRIEQFGEDHGYYYYHLAMISSCLEWTMKLTMAINSGMFEDSPTKIDLAKQNRTQYEEFLTLLCNNIKKYNKKTGKRIITQLYAELDKLWIVENFRF